MKERYWSLCIQITFSCYYFHQYEKSSHRFNVGTQIFFILVSLSSVASWIVWMRFPWLWSIIIASSQIGSSLNHFLAYAKRELILGFLTTEYETLQNNIERDWYYVSQKFDDEKINDLIHNYQCEKSNIEHKYDARRLLPWKTRFEKKANEITLAHFAQKFPVQNKNIHKEVPVQ